MKTAIIRLEPHDDALSTREYAAWVQAQRVILVWPGRSVMTGSRLDLTLIQRYAQKLGVEIAVVAPQRQVKQAARELGIPFFRTLKAAERAVWRHPRPSRRSLRWFPPADRPDVRTLKPALEPVPWLEPAGLPRVGVFSLGVLVVMALLAFFLPAAEIRFTPAVETQTLILSLRADPQLSAPSLSGGLPARTTTVVVEGQEQGEATGWNYTPLATAAGQVVFTNLTDRLVTVPAGTVVRTAGDAPVRFATTRAGTLRAEPAATLTVPVRALQPGNAGNAMAGTIQVVEGTVGSSVRVTNEQAVTGGSDRTVRAPSQEDYRQLEAALVESLEATAIREFEARLGPFDRVLPETLRTVAIVDSTREPAVGAPGERTNLRMQIEFEIWSVSEPHIEAIASAGFHSTLPAGYQVVPDSFQITSIAPAEGGSSSLPLEVEVERQVHAGWSEVALVRSVLGSPLSEVTVRLNRVIPLEGEPEVRVTPPWWTRMPFLSFRIELEAR